MNPLRVVGNQILANGTPIVFRGRLSAKLIPWLAKGKPEKAYAWVEHCQKLGINLLKVHGEGEKPEGILSDPPHWKPWPIQQMLNGNRVQYEQVKRAPLVDLYRLSHETGMAFEYVIDATLKNIAGMSSGMISHAISRTLDVCRDIAGTWPEAKIIFCFHDAYNVGAVRINEDKGALGLQAGRCRRWVRMVGDDKQTEFSFRSPGPQWKPEQYPDALIMVSEAGGDVGYPCGDGVKEYPIAATQTTDQVDLGRLRRFKAPVWIDATRWADDATVDGYMAFLEWCGKKGIHVIITDRKGALTDTMLPVTDLERRLRGESPLPPEPPPPEPEPEPPPEPESEPEWKTVFEREHYRVQER